MTTVWERDFVDSFDAAKEECAKACVARKDCKFAQVSREYDGRQVLDVKGTSTQSPGKLCRAEDGSGVLDIIQLLLLYQVL